MGFYADLHSSVVLSIEPPRLQVNDLGASLIELSHIHCADDIENLAQRVRGVAGTQFGKGPAANACAVAVAAAAENVLDHAKSPVGALVAAQRYVKRGELELAVVDLGLGIPTTLTAIPDYSHLSDLDAVQRSLDIGVTATGEDGRGQGLTELVDAIRRTGSSTLVIQSGRAHVTVGSAEAANQLVTPSRPVPGTWISLTLKP
jgi:anti-sigma regulatory factor (Ser/Thr protein kinase)